MKQELINKLRTNIKALDKSVLFNGAYSLEEGRNSFLTPEEAKTLEDSFESFVSENFLSSHTAGVDFILKKSWEDSDAPFSWDDVTNPYDYESYKDELLANKMELAKEFSSEIVEFGTFEDWFNSLDHHELKQKGDKIGLYIDEFTQEPYEWWAVSGWVCSKLDENGERVIDSWNYWGRCCTGQSIMLDYCVHKVFLETMLDIDLDEAMKVEEVVA